MLGGTQFILLTNHTPLTNSIHRRSEVAYMPRQLQHLKYISAHTDQVIHVSGKGNIVADSLSRIETVTFHSTLPYSDEQSKDKEDNHILQS